MTRWLALLWLLLVALAGAQEPSQDYRQAARLMAQGNYIKAREVAEEMLAAEPDSAEANLVLGQVYQWGEGNLARADYHLRLARGRLEATLKEPKESDLYRDTLWNLRTVAEGKEEYDRSLKLLDRYNNLFTPRLRAEYGWPLLKLGRYPEARRRLQEVVSDGQPEERAVALNTLGNLEYELGNLQKSLDYYQVLVEMVADDQVQPDAVYPANAGEAARALLDFGRAEQYLLAATQHEDPFTYAAPWGLLAELYLAQGRQPEAVEAVRHNNLWRANADPSVSVQNTAKSLQAAGLVLLGCGFDRQAAELMGRVVAFPDRNAGTSTEGWLVATRNLLIYSRALAACRERLREERSYTTGRAWWSLLGQQLHLGRQIKLANRKQAALVTSAGELGRLLQPYGPKSLNCPWLLPGLARALGRGPLVVAAQRRLASASAGERPYLLALLGELNHDQAQLEQALEGLPASEVLLRARLLARLGRFTEALQADPPTLRRLGLALPVEVTCSDRRLRRWLLGS
ncbi:MAG: tetratricopeptide repeat protein, partial [Candidatus Eremiobacteraeota bacterium]|nr:tetratricopeptide repeat protein [Candidatus Eremiobacteraeota bacterium]